jgi:hypothetical protein
LVQQQGKDPLVLRVLLLDRGLGHFLPESPCRGLHLLHGLVLPFHSVELAGQQIVVGCLHQLELAAHLHLSPDFHGLRSLVPHETAFRFLYSSGY